MATTAATPAPLGTTPIGETERAVVVAVVDGDTIRVDRGYGVERVRYIGVDTPETVHPSQPVQWMGKEAAAANRALVEGREVLLERDLTERDKYDRLLRYVWVEDPASPSGMTMVNLALLAGGFAQVVTYPPDVRYVDPYLAAQREAREQGRGLWADPGSEAEATPSSSAPTGGGDCDPAYPDACIPPSPPDLDCGDVTFRRFKVLPADPHRFDLDFDGVGCES